MGLSVLILKALRKRVWTGGERGTKATSGYLMLFKIIHNRSTDSGGLVPHLLWGHTGLVPWSWASFNRNCQQLPESRYAWSQDRQQLLHTCHIHQAGTVYLLYCDSTTRWPHLPMSFLMQVVIYMDENIKQKSSLYLAIIHSGFDQTHRSFRVNDNNNLLVLCSLRLLYFSLWLVYI